MNRVTAEKRAQIVACLVEGNSIRATVRMTGASKNTIAKLLLDLGTACSVQQDHAMRDLTCERIQCDEIWTYCYAKQRNVPADHRGELGYGDVWTWVAIDADTKLVPSYRVGARDLGEAQAFMTDLAKRLKHRVQLTTDGHHQYLLAAAGAFQGQVDYAQLIKIYGNEKAVKSTEQRYSPPACIGQEIRTVSGDPDPQDISTSYIERQNLTMRMGMRRFTRLTNGFSKKLTHLAAAVSLHFMHYNYCRVHSTLGKTPAMAAGITDHVWKLSEVIALLEAAESTPIKRGRYKRGNSD